MEVVDLTGADEVEVACDEAARKRARHMPLPFSAPEPPPREAKPDAKCAICLEPMVEMACGPCGDCHQPLSAIAITVHISTALTE